MRVLILIFIIFSSVTADAIDFSTLVTFFTASPQDVFVERSFSYGDLNGDKKIDLLFTTYSSRNTELNLNIFYGDNWKAKMYADQADVLIRSNRNDGIRSIWAQGDIDDDGNTDLLFHSDTDVYLFYGGKLRRTATPGDADITIQNNEESWLVKAVTADDINADGYDDIIIGAKVENYHFIYIFYNEIITPNIEASRADLIIEGENPDDGFGESIYVINDVTKDSYKELLVGAPSAFNSGAVYMFYRPYQSGKIYAADADVVFFGNKFGDKFGYTIMDGGDINGDKINDVVISAPLADIKAQNEGAIYVYFGKDFRKEVEIDNADAIIEGSDSGDEFGIGFCSLNDITKNNKNELVIASHWAITQQDQVGRLYMIDGNQINNRMASLELPMNLSGRTGEFIFNGIVAPCGDINSDGLADFFVRSQENVTAQEMVHTLQIMTIW